MKLRSIFLLSLFSFFFLSNATAQQTGSFNLTWEFNAEDRIVSCYVPTDYNESTSYQLVVGLHGSGDNSTSFRDALINSAQWHLDMPNTILIFPDGGEDQSSDFLSPEGDEQFVYDAIDSMIAKYNIDESKVFLEGFSLGGRSALSIGLATPEKFKGLLLHTPAIQGIHDLNDTELFNYDNASKVQMLLFWGDADFTYRIICDSLLQRLIQHDGRVVGAGIPNVGHQPVLPKGIISILSELYSGDVTIQIIQPNLPNISCQSTISPKVQFRNVGKELLESVEFKLVKYRATGQADVISTKLLEGLNLQPYQIAVVEFDEYEMVSDDTYNLGVIAIRANGDTLAEGNHRDAKFDIIKMAQGLSLPYTNNFTDDDFFEYWKMIPSGHNFTWLADDAFFDKEADAMALFNTILFFNNIGVAEDMLSAPINLTTATSPVLSLDVAFNYHTWGQPYFENTFTLSDTLEILISTDCGSSFESIYRKAGNDLKTTTTVINNPLSLEDGLFFPTPNQWKKFQIDLSEYKESATARFIIRYISGLGGCIYIDNFVVAQSGTGVSEEETSTNLSIYPNPATDFLNVSATENLLHDVNIYDMSGRKVYSTSSLVGISDLKVDLRDFAPGAYILETLNGNKFESKKFVVNSSK